jgi:RNA polymerase sigma factor for flagellar operon FliA
MQSRRVSQRQSGNDPSAERLVLAHLPLVRFLARKVLAGLPAHVELNDLIQDGVCGLIGAARRYDARRDVPFPAYARHRIRGAILDGLRRVDPATRDLRSKVKRLEAAAHDLGDELGRQPTGSEIAARAGTNQQEWACIHVDRRANGAAGAGAAPTGAEPCNLRTDESWRPDVQAGREELRAVLVAAMESLPARYREIMLLYHWDGLTMGEIGLAFGINESRVSQIHKRALELMAGCLTSIGITSSDSLLP